LELKYILKMLREGLEKFRPLILKSKEVFKK